jgi:hypothetical protein
MEPIQCLLLLKLNDSKFYNRATRMKNFILAVSLSLFAFGVSADLFAQVINGSATATAGQTLQYTYNPGYIVLGSPWSVVNGTLGI